MFWDGHATLFTSDLSIMMVLFFKEKEFLVVERQDACAKSKCQFLSELLHRNSDAHPRVTQNIVLTSSKNTTFALIFSSDYVVPENAQILMV